MKQRNVVRASLRAHAYLSTRDVRELLLLLYNAGSIGRGCECLFAYLSVKGVDQDVCQRLHAGNV